MKKIIFVITFLTEFVLVSDHLFSQVTLSGPTCVMPGAVYEYTITGNWDSTSTMSVCINGGAIYDSLDSNECTPAGPPVARVLVDWDTSGIWSLTLNSTSGNQILKVSAIVPLTPGSIDSASKTQMIAYDSVPSAITCSADVGGSCMPAYNYQWQQSYNMSAWTDIPGATNASLSFSDTLKHSSFFRRKVTEITSGTIGASDAAAVYLITQRPGSDSTYSLPDSASTGRSIYNFKSIQNKVVFPGMYFFDASLYNFLHYTDIKSAAFILAGNCKKPVLLENKFFGFADYHPFHETFLLHLLRSITSINNRTCLI